MTGKQKIKWIILYHPMSVMYIIFFTIIFITGGFKDEVFDALIATAAGLVVSIAIEVAVRELAAAILGYDFFAWIWNDPWAARKYLEREKKKQEKKQMKNQ